MNYRMLSRTGLRVSELGFGCGNVGGLLIRGAPAQRVRAVARAVDLGFNYFDTAPSYGDGQSETNLGAALKELGAEVHVGTKVRLATEELATIKEAITRSVEESLMRLGQEYVDLIQLHNSITVDREDRGSLTTDEVLEQVVPTLQSLQEQGKVRFWGMTGFGDTDALLQVIETGAMYTTQACYNLLNPSAGAQTLPGFAFQDFGGLIDRAAQKQMGVIAIRVLAAGALSGVEERHPVAAPSVAPMGTGRDYQEDVASVLKFEHLIENGYVDTLVEAAVRFVIANEKVSTALVGYSSQEQLEQVVEYASKGPLPVGALKP